MVRSVNVVNLLFTAGGRRVELIKAFREALVGQGLVVVTDIDPTAPALYVADVAAVSPAVTDAGYIDFLLALVTQHNITAIIPLIDPELPLLAHAKKRFAQVGCAVLTMDEQAVDLCGDKWLTAQFFQSVEVPTPVTHLPTTTSVLPDGLRFPVVVKPSRGSSGKDVMICSSNEEVQVACSRIAQPIIQERLLGDEITIDVLGDLNGNVINVVQRKRLKVRAGEVERGITIWDPEIETYALKAARALKPVGCINLQCFLTDHGPVFTEINARFGGGYPLAEAAGAGFPRQICRLLQGEQLTPCIGEYERGVLLLRYDTAVVLRQEELVHA
jgi:carbamoyl-phosphate synthase large subunit